MRKLLILFSWFLSFISFSQQSEWEFYKDIDGVKFETRTIECSGNELLTFRISNMNDYSVYVSLEGGSMDRWTVSVNKKEILMKMKGN